MKPVWGPHAPPRRRPPPPPPAHTAAQLRRLVLRDWNTARDQHFGVLPGLTELELRKVSGRAAGEGQTLALLGG